MRERRKERNIGVARGNPCFLRRYKPPHARRSPSGALVQSRATNKAQTERTFRNKRQTNVAAFPTIAC